MQKISADLIITNTSEPLKDGVVIYDETTGIIQELIEGPSNIDRSDVKHHSGVLVPGYVNAHCHLELSHLKGVIDTGTGLIPFIKGVVTLRDFPQEYIDQEIAKADQEMYDNGITAVGDISNKIDTASVKMTSKMRYYTFVEMFDFLQEDQAQATFEQYQPVYEAHASTGRHKKSYVPHAPYSVSQSLFSKINQLNKAGATVSIHNQELAAENELYMSKTGEFIDFFRDFRIPMERFNPIHKPSIDYTMQHLSSDFNVLMVHNTKTTREDIIRAQTWNQQTYWVTCPNANLYIENSLPQYKDFTDCDAQMCIGTDSLSSNWQLSIFEEMKTIKRYQSNTEDTDIIRWATYNGAKALGYHDLGSITKGTAPGLNWIDVNVVDGQFDLATAHSSTRVI